MRRAGSRWRGGSRGRERGKASGPFCVRRMETMSGNGKESKLSDCRVCSVVVFKPLLSVRAFT